MALIRCPNCNTSHDLDAAFLATGRRKVRCASCRSIFDAVNPESESAATLATLQPEPKNLDQLRGVIEPLPPERDPGLPATAAFLAPPEENLVAGTDISAGELEALFAAEARPRAGDVAGDVASRARGGAATAAQEAAPLRREAMPARAGLPAAQVVRKSVRKGMMAAMVMAAGLATLSALALLREDAMRLFPGTARLFERVGLSASARGLDIVEVQSQLITEQGHELLEVSGRIVNNSQRANKVPVLRFAIRGSAGNELYVWTAAVDTPELAAGDTVRFSRRLASPPPDSQSVMVRFVAKDDIVAAIR